MYLIAHSPSIHNCKPSALNEYVNLTGIMISIMVSKILEQ